MQINIDFAKYSDCRATEEECRCPIVLYENEDGICRHPACEGQHTDCGEIVAIEERTEDNYLIR